METLYGNVQTVLVQKQQNFIAALLCVINAVTDHLYQYTKSYVFPFTDLELCRRRIKEKKMKVFLNKMPIIFQKLGFFKTRTDKNTL